MGGLHVGFLLFILSQLHYPRYGFALQTTFLVTPVAKMHHIARHRMALHLTDLCGLLQ